MICNVKNLRNLFLGIVGCFFASSLLYSVVDEGRVRVLAEIGGYGYKTANLCELKMLLAEKALELAKSSKIFKFEVPPFIGIRSNAIKAFLRARGLDVDVRWREIVATTIGDAAYQHKVLHSKVFPAAFLAATEKLAEDIEVIFKCSSREPDVEKTFFGDLCAAGLFAAVSREFFATAQRERFLLAVRSTGCEDKKGLSNAGGNESKTNVLPALANIFFAMGDVASSYLRKKSLEQRLCAGDQQLFKVPLIPILVQKMIGERIGGESAMEDIVTAGVLFTREREGCAEGLVHIDATFGQAAAVVDTTHQHKVGIDTCYVDRENFIFPVVKRKNYRLITIDKGDGTFGPAYAENLDGVDMHDMKHRLCLTKPAVLALNTIAREIEAYYGTPMDVEFVIDNRNNIIYLVQARPLENMGIVCEPSYITNTGLAAIDAGDRIGCVASGLAGGALVRISSPDEILRARSLDGALDLYNGLKEKKAAIKCVVVEELPAATSHASTVFKGEKKAIFVVTEKEKFNRWIANKTSLDLLVDVQRGLLCNIQANAVFSSKLRVDLESTDLIRRGWFNYPIPLQLSLFEWGIELAPSPLLRDVLDSFPRDFSADVPKFSVDVIYDKLDRLKFSKNSAEAKPYLFELLRAAYSLQYRARKETLTLQGSVLDKAEKTYRLFLLEKVTDNCSSLLRHSLHYARIILDSINKFPIGDVRRLYPIRALEALLLQQENTSLIANESIRQFVDSMDGELLLCEKIKRLISAKLVSKDLFKDFAAVDLAKKGSVVAVTEQATDNWITFLGKVRHFDTVAIDKLHLLVDDMVRLGLFPVWLNIIFNACYDGHKCVSGGCALVFSRLLIEYNQSKEVLERVRDVSDAIARVDLSLFEKEASFDGVWGHIQENILEPHFLSEAFFRDFLSANRLGKLVLLTLMGQVINLFDLAIKTIESSARYTNPCLRVFRTRDMVAQYLLMLNAWIRLLDDADFGVRKGFCGEVLTGRSDVVEHLDYAQSLLRGVDCCDLAQIKPSVHFNAFASALGNGTFLCEHRPQTVDDAFQLTHQSLLFVIGTLMKKNLDSAVNFAKPVIVRQIEEEISKLSYCGVSSSVRFIFVRWEQNSPVFVYNLTLNNHSVLFDVGFDAKKNEARLTVRFMGTEVGAGEKGRWQCVQDIAEIVSCLAKLKICNIFSNSNGVIFTWVIVPEVSDISSMWIFLKKMIESTCLRISLNDVFEQYDHVGGIDWSVLLNRFGVKLLKFEKISEFLLERQSSLDHDDKLADFLLEGLFKNPDERIVHEALAFLEMLFTRGFAISKACKFCRRVLAEVPFGDVHMQILRLLMKHCIHMSSVREVALEVARGCSFPGYTAEIFAELMQLPEERDVLSEEVITFIKSNFNAKMLIFLKIFNLIKEFINAFSTREDMIMKLVSVIKIDGSRGSEVLEYLREKCGDVSCVQKIIEQAGGAGVVDK